MFLSGITCILTFCDILKKNYYPINQMFLSLVSGCLAHNTPSARPQPSEALNSLYLSPPGNGGTLFGLRKISYY